MVMSGYRKAKDLPAVIPVFPLDGALLLPGGVLPLQIFEPRYLNMVDDAMTGERIIGMIQTTGEGERHRHPALARVGCAGRITSYSETSDGKYLIALTGLCRFRVAKEVGAPKPYREVRADFAAFETDLHVEVDSEFERTPFLSLLRRYLEQRGLGIEWEVVNAAPAQALINSLCMALPFTTLEKQALLEAPDLDGRRGVLTTLLEIDAASGAGDGTGDDDAPPPLQ